jgi:Tol biopolymer transport system component
MSFDLSPDDRRLVFSWVAAAQASLWIHDMVRGTTSRLTFGASSSYYDPRWGPGAEWVAANRPAPPPLAIVKIQSDGRESVISAPEACLLDDVASDGRHLLCRPSARHVEAIPFQVGGKPLVVRKPPAGFIDQTTFSPDSRWIAFNADESGQFEVYVTAFPAGGERWPVSRGGGVQPVWRQDGRELYYLGLDGILNAVEVHAGDRPQLSVPTRLFDTGLAAPSPWVEQYAVSRDGQRVLILKPVDKMVRNSIGVILHWPALLQAQSAPR